MRIKKAGESRWKRWFTGSAGKLLMAPAPVLTEEVRVSAHQCDFCLRWKPAAMFLAMIEAASLHADALGFGFESMHANEMAWVLSRLRVHFHAFPGMGETVSLQTWPRGVQQRLFFTRDFLLTDAQGQPLASATSAWMLINPAQRRILLPHTLVGSLPLNEGRYALDVLLEKINPPEGLPERLVVEAGYSAVDVMGHANSARYVEWLCDAIGIQTFEEKALSWLQVNFNRETKPGERLSLRLGPDGGGNGRWLAEGYNLDAGARGFEAEFGLVKKRE
jgi:medium-chain acyl-[acyl-carrier-protein] hydrolase